MKNNKIIIPIALLIFLVLFVVAILYVNNNSEDSDEASNGVEMKGKPKTDNTKQEMTNELANTFASSTFQFQGSLEDVTEGETIRGINSAGNSTGTAQFEYSDGEFKLKAVFEDLPNPIGDDFYEGWLVRRSTGDFISTGKASLQNGIYTNYYSSKTDYTDYDYYVLTLEPNDRDLGPDVHIVEGQLFDTFADL